MDPTKFGKAVRRILIATSDDQGRCIDRERRLHLLNELMCEALSPFGFESEVLEIRRAIKRR